MERECTCLFRLYTINCSIVVVFIYIFARTGKRKLLPRYRKRRKRGGKHLIVDKKDRCRLKRRRKQKVIEEKLSHYDRERKMRERQEIKALAYDLPVDFRCVPHQSSHMLLPQAAETASRIHLRVALTQMHRSAGSETERKTYFSVRMERKEGKKER